MRYKLTSGDELLKNHAAFGGFSCGRKCAYCIHQVKTHNSKILDEAIKPLDQYMFDHGELVMKARFQWLMEHLLPPNPKFKGCELIFPDTAFLKDEQCKFVIKNDKDHCLMQVKNSSKISLNALF